MGKSIIFMSANVKAPCRLTLSPISVSYYLWRYIWEVRITADRGMQVCTFLYLDFLANIVISLTDITQFMTVHSLLVLMQSFVVVLIWSSISTPLNPSRKQTPHSFKGTQLENKSLYRFVIFMIFLDKILSYNLTLSL